MNRAEFLSLFAIPFLPKVDLPKNDNLIVKPILRNGKKVGNYIQNFREEFPYKNYGIMIPQGEGKFKLLKEGGSVEMIELKWKDEKFKSEVVCNKL